jgi:hypothetical protein
MTFIKYLNLSNKQCQHIANNLGKLTIEFILLIDINKELNGEISDVIVVEELGEDLSGWCLDDGRIE